MQLQIAVMNLNKYGEIEIQQYERALNDPQKRRVGTLLLIIVEGLS